MLLTGQVWTVADILMGAAHADETVDRTEARCVRILLEQLVGSEHLPGDLIDHLLRFDPREFHLESACRRLHLVGERERRQLLELVAAVSDADDVHDLNESAYLIRVARLLGAQPEEYSDLVVSIVATRGR